MTTTTAPALIARADRFVTVLGRHGLIVTGETAATALRRVDIIDRIGAAPAGTLARQAHRVAAAARTLFPDFDALPAGSPHRGMVRRVVSEALVAAA